MRPARPARRAHERGSRAGRTTTALGRGRWSGGVLRGLHPAGRRPAEPAAPAAGPAALDRGHDPRRGRPRAGVAGVRAPARSAVRADPDARTEPQRQRLRARSRPRPRVRTVRRPGPGVDHRAGRDSADRARAGGAHGRVQRRRGDPAARDGHSRRRDPVPGQGGARTYPCGADRRRRDHDRHGAGHRVQRGRAAAAPHPELARGPELQRRERRRGPGAARLPGRRVGRWVGRRLDGRVAGHPGGGRGSRADLRPVRVGPIGTGRLRPGARADRHHRLAQHRPAHPGRPARQGRARRLLDVLVHQLPAHAAAPDRLVREVPRRRARHRGRALPRVRLREGHRERQGQRRPARGHVPDRSGQRLRHLAGLPTSTTGPRTTS